MTKRDKGSLALVVATIAIFAGLVASVRRDHQELKEKDALVLSLRKELSAKPEKHQGDAQPAPKFELRNLPAGVEFKRVPRDEEEWTLEPRDWITRQLPTFCRAKSSRVYIHCYYGEERCSMTCRARP